jgi:methionyl aminopeptidase
VAIIIKSQDEIAVMREAGRVVALAMAEVVAAVRPGVRTKQLDEIAYRVITRQGARPSFLNYRGYPASVCVSINNEVVHGIPSPRRVLQEGDIVSLDLGALYKGFHGDMAMTVPVGKVAPEVLALLEATKGGLAAGIAAARAGAHVGDISAAIQSYVEARGFSVVRDYVGHGIGRSLHEEPQVPNFGVPGTGVQLRVGMTLAIEPMVNMGRYEVVSQPDGWTVVTKDGSWSAHFEHTIAITEGDAEILTVA